ncbi:hypothetical protein BON30_05735 [Cystobacter ferrugineus]|uniref:Uncharacterized protein n=1 Tax=Cystobacter ferrugineus TaxID=83449 RepID=A0A1L9BK82_9BACT|nr:hypothetical protein BON30_05735 [Cystobacter ferrugineus]
MRLMLFCEATSYCWMSVCDSVRSGNWLRCGVWMREALHLVRLVTPEGVVEADGGRLGVMSTGTTTSHHPQ